MDLNELKKLIKIVDESNVSEVEIEQDAAGKSKGRLRIRIAKMNGSVTQVHAQPLLMQTAAHQQSTAPIIQFESRETIEKSSAERPLDVVDKGNHIEVKSPIVGTFYRSPAPDADAYVQIGTEVKPGQTLCIIEAMKIMNEIESDVAGKVSKILVENGQPVEYNQTLFLIEKS